MTRIRISACLGLKNVSRTQLVTNLEILVTTTA